MRSRFEVRRSSRRRTVDRIIARLTGLDLKLEQYRRGERFVAGVARIGGDVAIGHLWDGPHALPTDAEMEDPAAWVRVPAIGSASAPARRRQTGHNRSEAGAETAGA